MHKSLVALVLCVPVLVLGSWFATSRAPEPAGQHEAAPITPLPVPDGRLARLEQRVEELQAELARLSLQLGALRGQGPLTTRAPASEPAGSAQAVGAESAGPERYLELYVRSFDGGGTGSEFHRLAVEAFVPELVPPISALLLGQAQRPEALLLALTRMFGDARLVGNRRVEETLLALLRRPLDGTILAAALRALTAIGDGRTAWALEALVWSLDPALQRQALTAIVELSGEAGNAAVARLLRAAPDEATAIFLLGLLRPTEVPAALDAFATARAGDVPLRLAGAERIAHHHDEAVVAFVEQWSASETDERVLRALGDARRRLSNQPPYGPLQATGPPNAQPTADDPRAWASQEPDAGPEWLELDYPQALRVSSVRVFQVNVGGALTELVAIEPGGARHTLWRGTSSTATGPFEITIPTTAYRVAGLRLVLDTRRAAGWNEIDAVELRGPDGAAWASRARASSSYGAGRSSAVFNSVLLR